MSSGPSKQELDMYWKNSRQYFDELAKHYRETDPEYYNKYIAPYYANPFVSQPQFQTQSYGKQSSTASAAGGRSKIFTVMIAMILLIAGMGAAVFFMMRSENYSNEHSRQIEKQTEQQKQNIEPPPERNKTAPEETPTSIEQSEDYEKGI